MSPIPTVELCGKPVGKVGLGLMQLTWTPQPVSDEVSFKAMKAAADAGSTAWSTASFYGNPGHAMANIEMLGRFFKKYPEYIDEVVLVVKGGMYSQTDHDFTVEKSRKQLKAVQEALGAKKIDAYSLARLSPNVPKEDVFKGLKVLQDEGLFGYVAASEVSAETLDLMSKYVKVACVEIEVSLWSYEQNIQDALAWCNSHKVPVYAYSPLGRGFITRTYKSPDDIPEGDFKRTIPRFQGEAFYENLKLVDQLDELAKAKNLKTSQLAIAWVCSLNPYTIPIPGSSNPTRVAENAQSATIELTAADTKGINDILSNFEFKGGRYDEHLSKLSMQ